MTDVSATGSRRRSLAAGLLGAGVAGLAVVAMAAAGPGSSGHPPAEGGITVDGVGEVELRPEQLVVRVWISGKAEVAAEAHQAWIQARARAQAAYEGAGIDGLTIRPQGPTIEYSAGMGDDMAMQGFVIPGQQQDMESNVNYREQLELVVEGVGELDDFERGELVGRVLDTALDAGLELGSAGSDINPFVFNPVSTSSSEEAGLVSWEASDAFGVEQAACAAALEDARRRAQGLAALAGVGLGRVRSMRVTSLETFWATASAVQRGTASMQVVYEVL